MKFKLLVPILILLLISSLSFATSNQQSYTYDYQYEKYGKAYPSSPFSNLLADGDDDIDLSSYGWGADFYPKVCDIDNDGILEILSFVSGDENIRVLNYNFDESVIELEYVLDVTDTGHGINDIVCLDGINDNYNIVLVVTNTSTEVTAREYAWNEGTQSLDELYEYIDEDMQEMIPTSRIGCYEGGTYYWCYYEPDADSNFQLIRLTNSVEDNTHSQGYNVTAGSLYQDGYTPAEIEDLSSNAETRFMPIYLIQSFDDYTFNKESDPLQAYEKVTVKDVGTAYGTYRDIKRAPLVTGSNEVVTIFDDDTAGSVRILKIDLTGITSEYIWDTSNIGPVVAGGMAISYTSDKVDYSDLNDDMMNPLPVKDATGVKPFAYILGGGGGFVKSVVSNFNTPMQESAKSQMVAGTGADLRQPIVGSLILATDYNYDFDSEYNYDELCTLAITTRNGDTYSGCYNFYTESSILTLTYAGGTREFPIGITTVNGEKSVITYEAEAGEFYYYTFSDLSTKNDLDVSYNGADIVKDGAIEGFPVFADLNADGITELVIAGETGTYIGSAGYVADNDLIVVENSSYGYYDVNCESNATTNTTIKFRECLGTYECSYISDLDPTTYEKVCTSCGGTQTYACGEWDELEPSIVCNNLTTGSIEMSFDFYRSVSSSASYLTILRTNGSYIDANLLFGSNTYKETLTVASTSCDTGDLITPPDVSEEIINATTPISGNETTTTQPTYDDPDDLFTALLGGVSSLWKIVLGICLVLGITYTVATSTKNVPPFIIGLTAVLATILATALGFLPAYILILIILTALIFIIIAKMSGGE